MKNHYQAMHESMLQDSRYVSRTKTHWLELYHPEYVPGEPLGEWKFRFSVAPHDLEQAWNIIADTLMKDRVGHIAKVASGEGRDMVADAHSEQRGKSITIYTRNDIDPAHYKAIFAHLEAELRNAGIAPGLNVKGDRTVPGSTYMSYRNDRDENGRYNDADKTRSQDAHLSYNPRRVADPYATYMVAEPLADLARYPAMGNWQPAMTGAGMVARVPVTAENADRALAVLQACGLNPELHNSASLGMTVRLSGQQAADVMLAQQRFYRQTRPQDWKHAQYNDGTAVCGLAVHSESEANHVVRILQQQGLHPSVQNNPTLGPAVVLTAGEADTMRRHAENSEMAQGEHAMYTLAHRVRQTSPAAFAPLNAPTQPAPAVQQHTR